MELDRFATKKAALDWIQENVKGCAARSKAEKYLRSKIPLESHYQEKIMDAVRKRYPTAFVWKEAAGPYSRKGIPDISAVIDGHYYGFEVKRPLVGTLSPIQKITIMRIERAGGTAGVVCFPEDALRMIDGRDCR